MESFEFLGGRYNRPEQIMSGPVQAFRAQSAADGRTVFIHRVSTTEAPEEQSALLKLLTTALVKSTDTKRLVLDFGEENGYWYVVTESEPQCALLREWLQLEIEAAVSGAPRAFGPFSDAHRPQPHSTPPAGPSYLGPAEPGEFTRFLQARPASPSLASAPRFIPPSAPPPPVAPQTQQDVARTPSEFSQLFQAQNAPLPPQTPPSPSSGSASPTPDPFDRPKENLPKAMTGEFTSFFNPTAAASRRDHFPTQTDLPAKPPVFSPPAFPASSVAGVGASEHKEAGEFTKYFKPGLPTPPPRVSTSAGVSSNFDRSHNNPYVQRPNTPVPSPAPKAESGEFTKLFSRPDNTGAPASPRAETFQQNPTVRSDPFGFAKGNATHADDLSDNLFSDRIEVGEPLPPSQPSQSEFSRVFGPVGTEAPPVLPPSVVAQTRDSSLLEEHHYAEAGPNDRWTATESPISKPGASPPTQAAPLEQSPGEFTKIMQGGYKSPAKPPDSQGAPVSAPAAGVSPIRVNVTPVSPLASLPRAGVPVSHLSNLGHVSGSAAGLHLNASPQGGASINSALGSAHVTGPHLATPHLHAPPPAQIKLSGSTKPSSNLKLIVFFVLIGVLTVVLIAVILFMMKSR